MKTKYKIKNNGGSALVLAIIATALLTIVVGIITFQINNQLRVNKKSYDDMQSKYAAEAGIEKSIHEIVMDIDTLINKDSRKSNNFKVSTYNSNTHNNNDSCPKVRFENGMPVINSGNYTSGDGFARLIYNELLLMKSNSIYNSAFGVNLVSVLGSDYYLLVGTNNIRNYYEINIRNMVENIATGHVIYNNQQLEGNINYFIDMLNTIMADVSNVKHNLKDTVLADLAKMKDCMLEIKCRLGMNNSTNIPEVSDGNIIIPYYSVSISNNNLSFGTIDNKPNKSVSIEIEYDKNKNIINIDFSNLNAEYLEALCGDYRIRADIDFIFVKNGSSYEIQQRVNSYERIN